MPNWLRMVLAIAAAQFLPDGHVPLLSKLMEHFPFVAAGMWFGAGRIRKVESMPGWAAVAGFLLILVPQMLAFFILPTPPWASVVLGTTGTAMLFLLSRAALQTRLHTVFSWLGQASLCIFILAPYVQGIVRLALVRLVHTTAYLPQVILTCAVILGVCGLLWHQQRRLHIQWLFHWPEKTEAKVQRSS
jgi:peptidoglycan/LPS O-acetylase OafA/YrhL